MTTPHIYRLLDMLLEAVGEPDGEMPDWAFNPKSNTMSLSPRAMAVVLAWAAKNPAQASAMSDVMAGR